MPDRSLWSGEAGLVIAKTLDGDIGVLPGHAPVFGILSPGSLVRIREVPGDDSTGDVVRAAVRDGFLSVTDDRVSILASVGELADDIDAVDAPGRPGRARPPRPARRPRPRSRSRSGTRGHGCGPRANRPDDGSGGGRRWR